jgi:hypothetical protein
MSANREADVNQKTYYALFLVDESGLPLFAGAFQEKETAEAKGKASGKTYEIKPTVLEA